MSSVTVKVRVCQDACQFDAGVPTSVWDQQHQSPDNLFHNKRWIFFEEKKKHFNLATKFFGSIKLQSGLLRLDLESVYKDVRSGWTVNLIDPQNPLMVCCLTPQKPTGFNE